MGFTKTLRISASALTAERLRKDVIANNIANAHTTGPKGPYHRQRVVFRAIQQNPSFSTAFKRQLHASAKSQADIGTGVKVVRIAEDNAPGQRVYEPGHPDADEDGYVTYPNVNVVTEMVDLLSATKAYQANVTVINTAKTMALKALSIGNR